MRFLIALAFCTLAAAQTFEVASIKPSAPDVRNSIIEPMPGGGLRIEGVPMKAILSWAYQVQNYQIAGGPGWVETENWSIVAKPSAPPPDGVPLEYEKMTEAQRATTADLVHRRLQALLAEHFHLVLRRETRDQPAYALMVAKGGAKVKEAVKPGYIRRGGGKIASNGGQMKALAQFLAIDLGRPVEDRTGLAGYYEIQLEWTPEGRGEPGLSIFTAIQEQLGLRLEAIKAPTETLAIERIEKPAEN